MNVVSNINNEREFKFDNLRGLAIFFVVFGHFLGTLQFDSFYFINQCIHAFHAPLLFFVSGYFSKATTEGSIKAFKNILIPYLIFDAVLIIFLYFIQGSTPSMPFLIPRLALWYLLSLFLMRTFLPMLDKIKHIFWISLVISAIVGVILYKENFLAWYRTIYFLPVFLFGFYFSDLNEKIKINSKIISGIFIALLIPLVAGLRILNINLDTSRILSFESFEGVILRFFVISLAILIITLLYNIISNKNTVLTVLGQNSLAAYVLHIYFIIIVPMILNFLGLSIFLNNLPLSIIYVVVSSIFVCYITSRNIVTEYINKLLKWVNGTIFKSENKA